MRPEREERIAGSINVHPKSELNTESLYLKYPNNVATRKNEQRSRITKYTLDMIVLHEI